MFGSFANGLSTWNSDLDLVVTGVMEPDRISGGTTGYEVLLPALTVAFAVACLKLGCGAYEEYPRTCW